MPISIERVQTGVRLEKRTLKVLKALAEYLDLSLGDLLEGIVLHAFEAQAPFGAESLAQIARLKEVYGLTLTAADSHVLVESEPERKSGANRRAGAKVAKRTTTRRTGAKGR
jgi:hypothetical protein